MKIVCSNSGNFVSIPLAHAQLASGSLILINFWFERINISEEAWYAKAFFTEIKIRIKKNNLKRVLQQIRLKILQRLILLTNVFGYRFVDVCLEDMMAQFDGFIGRQWVLDARKAEG